MFYSTNRNEDVRCIEEYIGKDFLNCPYMYANLKKYGVENGKTELYIDSRDDEIVAVALRYYDCLHVYYHNDMHYFQDIEELIDKISPHTIFFPKYSDDSFRNLSGYKGKEVLVMSPKHFDNIDISIVKNATISDIPRIAQFMYTHYSDVYESVEIIRKQIQERMLDHYGRTKYIEIDGEIVACVSSFAELEDFAINSGLLVSDTQRGKKLGSIMLKSICEELENEGKRTIDIIVEDYSRVFHEKNGFEVVGTIVQYKSI